MRIRKSKANVSSRLLGLSELQTYLSIGENTARKIGKESGAVVKIGRRLLFDRQKIDEYIDSLKK